MLSELEWILLEPPALMNDLLRQAIEIGNDVSLAANLMEPGRLKSHEQRTCRGCDTSPIVTWS